MKTISDPSAKANSRWVRTSLLVTIPFLLGVLVGTVLSGAQNETTHTTQSGLRHLQFDYGEEYYTYATNYEQPTSENTYWTQPTTTTTTTTTTTSSTPRPFVSSECSPLTLFLQQSLLALGTPMYPYFLVQILLL